jgi:hypothetical protein
MLPKVAVKKQGGALKLYRALRGWDPEPVRYASTWRNRIDMQGLPIRSRIRILVQKLSLYCSVNVNWHCREKIKKYKSQIFQDPDLDCPTSKWKVRSGFVAGSASNRSTVLVFYIVYGSN